MGYKRGMKTKLAERWTGLWMAVLFAGVALLVFRAALGEGATLLSSDDNVGLLSQAQRAREVSWGHPWQGETLWGMPDVEGLRPSFALLRAVDVRWFTNWFHALCLGLAGWLTALYLRGKGVGAAGAVFGGLTAFWTGTNLTLTFAGHVGKYGVMAFCALSLWALGKWGRSGRAAWGAAAGAAAGAMFLEQGDVALFCAALLAPVGAWEGWRAAGGRWDWRRLAAQFAPAAVAAGLLAGGAALSAAGSGVTDGVESQSEAERWEFLTQWSQPPAESLDMIAPGWMGWKSGDPDGPYRGALGRSEGWERTGQGFRNFRLETVYVGALPLFFAALALAEGWRRRKEEGGEGACAGMALLWGALGAAALVLAFGKYTPAYRAVAALPGFSAIRNPNKFMHFFQLAWGVLAGLGVLAASGMEGRRAKGWMWAGLGLAGLAGLGWVAVWAEGGTTAEARCKAFALGWCAASFALAGAAAGGLGGAFKGVAEGWKPVAGWICAAWVAVEAAWVLGPHFIQRMPEGYVAENGLTRFLEGAEAEGERAVLAGAAAGQGVWLTYLFPYRGIATVNVTQLPRPPADYLRFWRAVGDSLRQWELAGVRHVVTGAREAGAAVRELGGRAEAAWTGEGAAVLRLKSAAGRVEGVREWRRGTDEEALAGIAGGGWRAGEVAWVAEGGGLEGEGGACGEVRISEVTVRPGEIGFTAEAEGEGGLVRVAEDWHPGWRARVDGEERPVERCDFMFQGVWVEGGRHEVRLRYAPDGAGLKVQWAGLLVGALAWAWAAVASFRRKGNGL